MFPGRKLAPSSAQSLPWLAGGNSQVRAPAHLAVAQEVRLGGSCPWKENNQLDQWARDENINIPETKTRSAASGSGDQSGWVGSGREDCHREFQFPPHPGGWMTQHFLLLLLLRPTPEAQGWLLLKLDYSPSGLWFILGKCSRRLIQKGCVIHPNV